MIHVQDLCRFIDILLELKPSQHIFNVGNKEAISVRKWVELCYKVAGKQATFVNVHQDIEQRNYFSFYAYEYYLDVSSQYELMDKVKPLEHGLEESFSWYVNNRDKVNKKSFIEFIDSTLC